MIYHLPSFKVAYFVGIPGGNSLASWPIIAETFRFASCNRAIKVHCACEIIMASGALCPACAGLGGGIGRSHRDDCRCGEKLEHLEYWFRCVWLCVRVIYVNYAVTTDSWVKQKRPRFG